MSRFLSPRGIFGVLSLVVLCIGLPNAAMAVPQDPFDPVAVELVRICVDEMTTVIAIIWSSLCWRVRLVLKRAKKGISSICSHRGMMVRDLRIQLGQVLAILSRVRLTIIVLVPTEAG
jgi:hypothetical protein